MSCWKTRWSCLHAHVKSTQPDLKQPTRSLANLKMVEVSACISSGDYWPGFKLTELFHVHASCFSDETSSYVLELDYFIAINWWQSTSFTFFRLNFLAAKKTRVWLKSWFSLSILLERHWGHAWSSAVRACYILVAKQTTFTAVFLNSSLVQQLIYIYIFKISSLSYSGNHPTNSQLLFYKYTQYCKMHGRPKMLCSTRKW